MEFIKKELKDIRPFVRVAIRSVNMYHSDFVLPLEHRIVYCISGTASFWIEDEFFEVKKNDLFYVGAGVPYKMLATDGAIIMFMYFDLTGESSHIRSLGRPVSVQSAVFSPPKYCCQYRLYDGDEEIRYVCIKNTAMTVKRAEKLWQYYIDKVGGLYNDDILSGMMITLLSMICMERHSVERRDSSEQVAQRLFEYIHANYNKKISIDDIADKLNYHKSYLNRCVKKQTGQSLYKCLVEYRLEQAMQFLMYTDISVAEVAEKVGFSGPKGFSTAFKNQFGISPSRVKKYEA